MTATSAKADASLPAAALPSDTGLHYDTAPADRRAEIDRALAEIDLDVATSILFFGSAAQEPVTSAADEMLERARAKDAAAAGQALNEMVTALRGLPVAELGAGAKPGVMARIFRGRSPVGKVLQRYQHVRAQVDAIAERLDGHTSRLMKDVAMLDRLYDRTVEYLRRLETYVAAGEEALRRLDRDTLPALAGEVERSGDLVKAQQLGDLRARRGDLERRVHDLRLTRQITMQSLPAIRIVQQNDKALIGKIASTLANTIPLWRQQLALALTMARSAQAGETLRKATDLTNELLTANAETLRTSTNTIRAQTERGIVDVAAVKQANDALIATIDDALRIADEGRHQREEATRQLAACEADLRQALVEAGERSRASGRRRP